MLISKSDLLAAGRFHLANPADFEGFHDWAQWLEALLHNPCSIFDRDGELLLLENKQLVERLHGLKIEIYANEHPPPHFHVKSPELTATFAIDDCRQLSGQAPASAVQKIKYWHRFSKPKLVAIWNATRPTDCTVGGYREP